MINIFKAFNPLNVLWLAILVFILRLGYIIEAPDKLQFVFVEPFARLLLPVGYEYAFSPVENVCIAAILVLAQALLLNFLVNKYNLLGRSTFLPSLVYVTVTALFPQFLVLSAPLICNFLLIWMLFKLFSFYKGEDAKSTAYDLGMIVALGSIIYLPYIYLFLSIWIGLVIFKPFNWREWISGILGYITVFFFFAVYYYLTNHLHSFYQIWAPLGTKFPNSINIKYLNYLVLIPVIILIGLFLYSFQQNYYKSYVQVRKSYQLLFFIFLIGGLSFYVKSRFNLQHFLLCAVPVAVCISYYFAYATRKWMYESLYLLLLISVIYFQFNTF
ncbi:MULTISPECIES: DUF6427 family protein [unclassified Mucilaginibacter]|uniref:DUF6427 family protein n=1 Tax=unclassified Mucilaginibacter TaxID=2617802 RepID=UPI0009592CD1|nr:MULTISPECIES: DUF6427 family protein [unclassified Mucilaginibacter]OJW16483.1 MAG: beta-carotene 15,15'-monooxygenase [Mucilaginibacter sp. 44-25]PLW88214.1 MAG: beta-carotene 15,15'-monooxygenase [Mucilaginibacter sp.]HEK20328.1 beta-carotene 15,15'-monooxygenase [Bacteroidota bacterium]